MTEAGKWKVLLVDDDQLSREAMADWLQSEGFEVLAVGGTLWAQRGDPAPPPVAEAKAKPVDLKPAVSLPISQVIMFNSGVGHFTRSGEVEGEVRVDLTFPEQDINDLIKNKQVQLLINTPTRKGPQSDEGKIRAMAVLHKVPIVTTLTGAHAAARAIAAMQKKAWDVRPLQDYFK